MDNKGMIDYHQPKSIPIKPEMAGNRLLVYSQIDVMLVIAVFLLMCFGLVMMSSAAFPLAAKADTIDLFKYTRKQIIFAFIGLVGCLVAFCFPINFWYKKSLLLFLLGIGLLIAVLLIGKEVNGAKRWISLGFADIQVSEFVRISLILFVAVYLKDKQNRIHNTIFSLWEIALGLGVVVFLLMLEPDLGATVVMCCIVLGMTFLAGVNLIHFISVIVLSGILGVLAVVPSSYRMARITGYMNPWENMYSEGYQLVNSLIAIGRGKLTGVGLGESLQKHYYLPEAHTDFVFSVLAEETGLVGVIIIMLLYMVIVWRAFVIAYEADKVRMRFASLIAYGIGLWIAIQSLINLSVTSGLLPTKGLTLPFVSYGGSSLVAGLLLIGILLRINVESRYTLKNEQKGRRQ